VCPVSRHRRAVPLPRRRAIFEAARAKNLRASTTQFVATLSSRARRAARPLDMSGETTLRGDLPGVTLTSSTGWTAEVYRHGAHVASWKTPDGEDLIFVSSDVGALPVRATPFATLPRLHD
jgi:hypothetical protein